jgi:hypothetical protein
VSGFAPTLQIEIPYALRVIGFSIGILMILYPGFDLIRRAKKMWLIVGMSAGVILFFGCALALYLGAPKADNPPKAVAHTETTIAPPSLPSLLITITELKQPDAQIHSGLWPQNLREHDPMMFVIRDVYISNSSTTRTVTLRIFLLPWTKQYEDRRGKLEGTGMSPWRGLMGRDDEITIWDKGRGLESTKYILSPVTIQPQTTLFGNLVFIMPPGLDVSTDSGKEVWGNILRGLSPNGVIIGNEPATDENKLNFLLEVTDVISNTSITIPVPGPGYHGQ